MKNNVQSPPSARVEYQPAVSGLYKTVVLPPVKHREAAVHIAPQALTVGERQRKRNNQKEIERGRDTVEEWNREEELS